MKIDISSVWSMAMTFLQLYQYHTTTSLRHKSKWYDIDETLIFKLIVFSDLNTQIMLLNNLQAELLDIVELDMVKLDMVDIS